MYCLRMSHDMKIMTFFVFISFWMERESERERERERERAFIIFFISFTSFRVTDDCCLHLVMTFFALLFAAVCLCS